MGKTINCKIVVGRSLSKKILKRVKNKITNQLNNTLKTMNMEIAGKIIFQKTIDPNTHDYIIKGIATGEVEFKRRRENHEH